jgi:hypothetical protein
VDEIKLVITLLPNLLEPEPDILLDIDRVLKFPLNINGTLGHILVDLHEALEICDSFGEKSKILILFGVIEHLIALLLSK